MIFFTADTHFCHSNIIHSCERPFDDVDEMNLALIKNWNSLVSKNDEVYILGDFLYRGTAREANEILSKLKGKKYLIKGNHEKYLTDSEFRSGAFKWVKDYYILKHGGTVFVLSHYPMLEWYKSHHGSIHLYGHVHNSWIKNPEFGEKLKLMGPNAINVGVDLHDFYPVSMYQIIEAVGL